MPTYLTPDLSLDDEVVPEKAVWFFRRNLQNVLYDVVIREFRRLEDAGEINKLRLANRLRREPSQITRWLCSPGNWTLNTISDLMVGMAVDPTRLVTDLVETPLASVEDVVKSLHKEPLQASQPPADNKGIPELLQGRKTTQPVRAAQPFLHIPALEAIGG